VPCVLEIEQEWNDPSIYKMISTEIEAQPWPKGYAPTVPFFCVYLVEFTIALLNLYCHLANE